MKMYIPEIGDKIKLTSDWTFRLFHEQRNAALFKLLKIRMRGMGGEHFRLGEKEFFFQPGPNGFHVWCTDDGELLFSKGARLPHENAYYSARAGKLEGVTHHEHKGDFVTLKAGQVLSIDRVYIRRGASDFSSITFNYLGAPKGSGRVRFWAKLADVNMIEFEEV